MQIGLGKHIQPLRHFAGDDVFIQFDLQMAFVVGLDHAINRAINGFFEQLLDGGGGHGWLLPK